MNNIEITEQMDDANINAAIEEYNTLVDRIKTTLYDQCMDKWRVTTVHKNGPDDEPWTVVIGHIQNPYWPLIARRGKDSTYANIRLILSHNTRYTNTRFTIDDCLAAKEKINSGDPFTDFVIYSQYESTFDTPKPDLLLCTYTYVGKTDADTYVIGCHDFMAHYMESDKSLVYPIKKEQLLAILDALIAEKTRADEIVAGAKTAIA